MPKLSPLLEELQQRWQTIFQRLHSGSEVPPAMRLRAEGMMESAVLLQLATKQELQTAMAATYAACYQQSLPTDWQDIFPFPQIPGFGVRAPVYPSTKD